MGLFAAAWLFGEGLIITRWIRNHAPPTPGALLLPSAFFVGLAVLAMYEPARATAVALAWGVDLAVVLQIVGKNPGVVTGWPPPPIPDTQIWPSKAAAGPAATLAAPPLASNAALSNFVGSVLNHFKGGTTQQPGATTAGGRG